MKVVLLALVLGLGLSQASPAGASTASVAGPNDFGQFTLRYVADAGEANDVFVDFSNDFSGVDLTDSATTITAGAGCVTVSLHKVRCDVSSGDLVNASLGDENDILSISSFLDTGGGRLSGGDGDDRIRGNDIAGTNEILLGGRGDDSLFGRGGSEFLDGGPGADDLSGGTSCSFETAGQCFIDFDTVSYSGRTRNVHATADGRAADDGQRREGDTIMTDVERIVGGEGNDRLGGTTTNFLFLDNIPHLVGMQLLGREGDDHLGGGRAPDGLAGGPGDDVLRGAGRGDGLHGGQGDDRLIGGAGHDRFSGGDGQDRLLARDGHADRVNGGAGRDAAQIDTTLDHVARVENLF
jgi:Ca2+-binding RTX toxin-like protein